MIPINVYEQNEEWKHWWHNVYDFYENEWMNYRGRYEDFINLKLYDCKCQLDNATGNLMFESEEELTAFVLKWS